MNLFDSQCFSGLVSSVQFWGLLSSGIGPDNDMWRCVKELSAENSIEYKKELLRRLGSMLDNRLLQN